ncbi:TBC1 domain family member 2B isoform X4 [Ricinus communis]|uniref:TBC1 domain family member 2B isoform X4 n=1 Tax=Ricinus communis TaxID=3988 RepID=UPI0007725E04|nr:TBC1 domain family member 2B isoform X4 [Ricinus communis]|eukprot:XP_015578485.1 TBC1 domain family member 2B isoform X3 [Ricinus communis]
MLLSLLSRRSLEVDSRDAYGFALRPQHVQRYREYLNIYKEEEEERAEKWRVFLEQEAKSDHLCSSEEEEESGERLQAKTAEFGEKTNLQRGQVGDDSSAKKSDSDGSTDCDPGKEVQLSEEPEKVVQFSKVHQEEVQSSEEPGKEVEHFKGSQKEDKILKEPKRVVQHSEGPESEVHSLEKLENKVQHSEEQAKVQFPERLENEVQHPEEPENKVQLLEEPRNKELLSKQAKAGKIQTWSGTRLSLHAIESMMTSRVKKVKNMNHKQFVASQDNLLSTKEAELVGGELKEDVDGDISVKVTSDEKIKTPEEYNIMDDDTSPELFFHWKEELEFLVHGGVPKDLRGEVWQAFVGIKARRVERYYEELLAEETNDDDCKDHCDSTGAARKWKRQIEKDIPRTFPGHPALDEHGRDSLRRLLLAYARHNPSVGYCQAMNFFAGLLLLLMPEENAFWTLVGIIDDYFDGYYTEEMIESQVDQLVFEELMRERFPKLVNHLDYLGVQVAWISGPWFLSIFVNMIPWESVLRIWDVLLFEGNRVMLFRTALALMELYGPALVTTKDAGDAITLLQSLAGSTFDSSQLVFTACMGFLAVNEARLQELREKHRPAVLLVVEERSKRGRVWKDSKGLASKLYSFKHDPGSLTEEEKTCEGDSKSEHPSSNLDALLGGLTVDTEVDSLPDLQEQVVWFKVELCRLLEEKRSAILRAEELETAFMEMVKEDNRRQLSAKIEQLEQEVADLQQALSDKREQEAAMLQVLMRVEQEQRITEEARVRAERDAAAQRYALTVLQQKYEKAMASVTQMEQRVVMAESMLEATLQYESGQSKAQSSPRLAHCRSSTSESPGRRMSLLKFGLGWRDRNKGKPNEEFGDGISNIEGKQPNSLQKESGDQEKM